MPHPVYSAEINKWIKSTLCPGARTWRNGISFTYVLIISRRNWSPFTRMHLSFNLVNVYAKTFTAASNKTQMVLGHGNSITACIGQQPPVTSACQPSVKFVHSNPLLLHQVAKTSCCAIAYSIVDNLSTGFCHFAAILFMVALYNRADHYIFALWFLSSFLFFFLSFFSSPNLSGRRLDVYHTSTHGVALVRI